MKFLRGITSYIENLCDQYFLVQDILWIVESFLSEKPFMGSILVSVRLPLQYGLFFVGYSVGNHGFTEYIPPLI